MNSFRSFWCLFVLTLAAAGPIFATEETVYIGTYNGPEAKGIYSAKLDLQTGKLSKPVLAVETSNAAWLVVSPDGKHVYAANETQSFEGKPTGSVTATDVTEDGQHLKVLDQEPSGGVGPCHISLDPLRPVLFVANYLGGSIAALPIKRDGSLGAPSSIVQHVGSSINPARQDRPHAHEIISDPQGEYVYAVDLGLDRIKAYRYDSASGALIALPSRDVVVKPGTGPRHMVFNSAGDRLYVVGEMASDLTVYKIDPASGHSAVLQNLSTIPDDWKGENSSAEIQIDHRGKHIYVSNRGNDTLGVYEIKLDGTVKLSQRVSSEGKSPRNFALDPSGRFLVVGNQNTNSVAVFRIDPDLGTLQLTEGAVSVGNPVAIAFRPN